MQPTPLLIKAEPPSSDELEFAQSAPDQLGALGLGLRRRLLAMLVLPLCLLAMINAAFDYRVAGGAAIQQDSNLQRLAPLLADSLVGLSTETSQAGSGNPVILMAPPVEEFLKERASLAGYRLSDSRGKYIAGDEWIDVVQPGSSEAEFSSTQVAGVTFRIVSLRATSRVGEVIVQIADGSDARQQWWRALVFKVLVPNLILVIAAFFVVRWAVARALAPLMALARTVENRSPSDLHPIDPQRSPLEVRPLVLALNRLLETVNAQVQSQQRFVADAAHQLRTPLTGVQAQVEAWAQKGQQQSSDQMLLPIEDVNKLRDATRRTTQLANQLLVLSRVDAQSGQLQPMEKVDFRQVAEEVLSAHLDAATVKGVDLGLELEQSVVDGYGWLLQEALSNLVDNAVKYTPSGGHVTIRCGQSLTGDPQGTSSLTAWFEVEDSGPGIPEAERDQVLQRFYRSPGSQGTGNGLGLAIVDEIARLHGARLHLDRGMGQFGLRVMLELAVRESAN
jgi:two-component system, OmpR family, sensor histidine kinase TctE